MTAFFDTNVLVYAFNVVEAKSPKAMETASFGGCISVQTLNELVNVFRRKLRWNWPDIDVALQSVLFLMQAPLPLTLSMHQAAFALARDHNISIYDALIVAAALEARCDTLYSEDLQHGRRFGGLTVVNPFR